MLSLNLKFTYEWPASSILPGTGVVGMHYCARLFPVGSGDSNSSPHAGTASLLPTEPSPQPSSLPL